jgi:Sugar-specific transcriptional regulator TrmB.
MVKKIREIINMHSESEFYLCSGAGLRILSHVVEVALLASRKPFNLYYEPETEGSEPILVPATLYLNIYKRPSGLEEEVLKFIIANRVVSVKEITQSLHVKEKTVRNILTRLKKMGLVAKSGKGLVQTTPVAIALYG